MRKRQSDRETKSLGFIACMAHRNHGTPGSLGFRV